MNRYRFNKIEIFMLFTLLVILVLFFIYVSFGWFTEDLQTLISSDDSIIISSGENLEISLTNDEENWSNYIKLDDEVNLIDCTSNGIDFYNVSTLDENDNVIMSNPDSLEFLDKNSSKFQKYVYTIDLSFRTSSKMNVYLGNNTFSDSFVNPNENIFGNNLERRSYFSLSNPFSRDGICGAIRVAIYEYMDEYEFSLSNHELICKYVSKGVRITSYETSNNCYYFYCDDESVIDIKLDNNVTIDDYEVINTNICVLKNMWIPNDKYELSYFNGEALFNTNGNREQEYNYLTKNNNIIINNRFLESDYVNYITVGNNLATNSDSVNMQKESFKLLQFENSNSKNIKRCCIRIWIEGTDRESNIALDSGIIKFNLAFIGMNKEQNVNLYNGSGDTSILDSNNKMILYSNRDEYLYYYGARNEYCDDIEYSINGIDWYSYNGNENLEDYNKIYVRVKETAIKYKSNVVTINISY